MPGFIAFDNLIYLFIYFPNVSRYFITLKYSSIDWSKLWLETFPIIETMEIITVLFSLFTRWQKLPLVFPCTSTLSKVLIRYDLLSVTSRVCGKFIFVFLCVFWPTLFKWLVLWYISSLHLLLELLPLLMYSSWKMSIFLTIFGLLLPSLTVSTATFYLRKHY